MAEDAVPSPHPGKNAMLLISFQLASKFLLAFWTFYLARQLGAEQYGLWANLLAIAAILSAIQEMGTLPIFIKEISAEKQNTDIALGRTFSLYLLLSIIYVASTLILGWGLGYSRQNIFLLMFACLTFVSLIPLMASQAILFSHENFKPYVVSLSAGAILYIFWGIVFLYAGWGVAGVLLALIAGNLLAGHWIFRKVSKLYRSPVFCWEPKIWLNYIKAGFPLAASGMLYEAATRADRILIQQLIGNTAVGFFHSAFTVLQMFREILLLPIANSIYPRMAKTYAQQNSEFMNLFEKTNLVLLLLTVPLCLFCSVFSVEIIKMLFGPEYIAGAHSLAIMAWAIPPMFVTVMLNHILILENRQQWLLWTRATAFIFNGILNFLALEKWGIAASAVISVLTQCLLLLMVSLLLRNKGLFGFLHRIPPLLWTTILTGCVMLLIRNTETFRQAFFVPALAGMIAWVSLSLIFRVLKKSEIEWLKKEISSFFKTPSM